MSLIAMDQSNGSKEMTSFLSVNIKQYKDWWLCKPFIYSGYSSLVRFYKKKKSNPIVDKFIVK